MKVGDRILFVGIPGVPSEFRGKHGHITQVVPRLMATIGDDTRPAAIAIEEIVPDPELQHTVAGE